MAKNGKLSKTQQRSSMDGAPAAIAAWRFLRPVLIVAVSLALVIVMLVTAYHKLYDAYVSPVDEDSTEQVEIMIPSGSSLTKISEILEEAGLIRNAKVFKYYVDFTDMSSKLLAGTYTLSPSMTFDDIVDVIKRPNEMSAVVSVLLPEGLTLEEMADKIIEQGVLMDKREFLEICRTGKGFEDHPLIASVLASENSDQRLYVMEGYLFPDTYEFYTDATAKTVVTKLLNRFEEIFGEKFQKRAEELGMSVDEVVTLASLVEKEAKPKDFAGVSAVFHNRIEDNWLLGSDVTVQYFTGVDSLNLTDAELKQESLYNTYLHRGLPLGAVCNPGAAALEAALYPNQQMMKDGYFYFCLGDPETGEIVYSKTLEEHNQAVAKYKELWIAFEAKQNQKENVEE